MYKKDLEKLIEVHILPRIECEHRFLRARACWCLQSFSETNFAVERILKTAVHALIGRLTAEDEELPVKVEAALAIQTLLADQKGGSYLFFYII
jgi:importin-8